MSITQTATKFGTTRQDLIEAYVALETAEKEQQEANAEMEVKFQERESAREELEYAEFNLAPADAELMDLRSTYEEVEDEWLDSARKARNSGNYYNAVKLAYLEALKEYNAELDARGIGHP